MTTKTAIFETSRRGPIPAPLAVALIVATVGGAPFVATAQSSISPTPSAGSARSIEGSGLARAIVNYQALERGEKRFADLSPIELAELGELRALLQKTRPRERDTRETCIAHETKERGGTLTWLEKRVVDLICSQPGD